MRPVLLYDARCRACRFAARVVARVDRDEELGILPLQDEAAAPLLERLPEAERRASWRLVSPDGSLAGFGAGAPAVLTSMRRTRPVGRLLRAVPEEVLDAAYGFVARRRRSLGRLVPDGPAPRRFP